VNSRDQFILVERFGEVVIGSEAEALHHQKTVEVSGARVHLTGKEYQMLELLSLRKGTTLTSTGVRSREFSRPVHPCGKVW
jgi:DNA-binding response OmpR family regulator